MALVVALVPEAWSGDQQLPVNTVKAVYLDVNVNVLMSLLTDRVRGDLHAAAVMMANRGKRNDAGGGGVAAQLDGAVA